ncbi:MAG: tetratricopeptide repeat protein [Thiogranum sp.]
MAFFNALRDKVQPRHLDTYRTTELPSGDAYREAVRRYCDEINLMPSYTVTTEKELFEASVSYFRLLDKRGVGCASYHLARFYANGKLVERNYGRAEAYARKAVDNGFPRAYYLLAYMALHGQGRDRDEKEAEKLFRQAAGAGEPRAMFRLGELALKRNDIPQGLSWIERAIALGYTDAAFQLARFYLDGTGVKRDERKAFDLFTRATKSSHPLDTLVQTAESSHRDARVYLGWMYENGRATDKDLKQANGYYSNGATRGNAFAQWRLGDNMTRGAGIDKDMKKGMEWLRQAAAQGNADAKKRLAELTGTTGSEKAMTVQLPSPLENPGRATIPVKVAFSRPLNDGDSVEIFTDGVMAAKMEISGRAGITALRTSPLLPPASGVFEFVLRRRNGETTRLKREWRPATPPVPYLGIKTRMKGFKWKVSAKDREIRVSFTDSISFFYYVNNISIDTPGGSIRIIQTPLIYRAPRWQFWTTDSLRAGDVKLAGFEVTNTPFSEGIPFLEKYRKALEQVPKEERTSMAYFSARDIARDLAGALKSGKLEGGGPKLMKRYCEQITPMKLGACIRLCLEDGQAVYKTRGDLWIYIDGRKADPEVVYGF